MVHSRLEQAWFWHQEGSSPYCTLYLVTLKLKQEDGARKELQDQARGLGEEENRLSAELRTIQAARSDSTNPTIELEAALEAAAQACTAFAFLPYCRVSHFHGCF